MAEQFGGDKPKIIIDEDWKSQVQAEKAAAATSPDAPTKSAASGPEAQGEVGGEGEGGPGQMPAPSLASLVITLATQSMASLGMMADQEGKPFPIDLEQARYLVDTIGMLDAKTAGNQTPEEAALFEDALHQLRMAYVAVQQQRGQG